MGVLHEPAGGVVPTAPAGTPAAPDAPGAASARRGNRHATSRAAVSPVATTTVPPAIPASGELVRRLERGGLASREAGNVVAYLLGLKPVASGWRVAEIEHLRFLRALAADGRLES